MHRAPRQCARRSWFLHVAAGALALLAAGCSDPTLLAHHKTTGNVAYDRTFGGAVASDDVEAGMAARDVLANGGGAGDAAATLGLVLAVRYPRAAGLGGGGVCVVHDHAKAETHLLDFQPLASTGPQGGARLGVPMTARALSLVQARLGHWRWEQVIVPAEQINRRNGGSAASTEALASLRQRGGPTLYASGPLAAAVIDQSKGAITESDLRAALPRWQDNRLPDDGYDAVFGLNTEGAASHSFVVADSHGNIIACALGQGPAAGGDSPSGLVLAAATPIEAHLSVGVNLANTFVHTVHAGTATLSCPNGLPDHPSQCRATGAYGEVIEVGGK